MLEELLESDPLFAYQLCLDLVENEKQTFLNQVRSHLLTKNSNSSVRENVLKILTGRVTIDQTLYFLQNKSNTDKQLVAKIKNSIDAKSSVTHGSVIFANAFMCAGTSDDSFLRDNLTWVAKATNWGKFSAVACLGVIHHGIKGFNCTGLSLICHQILRLHQGLSIIQKLGLCMPLGLFIRIFLCQKSFLLLSESLV